MSKKGHEILTVDSQNGFTKEYLKNRVYLVDNGVGKTLYSDIEVNGKEIKIRDVWFDELSDLLKLEKDIHDNMDDKEMLVDVTRNEFIESLHLDYVLGAYYNGEMIGAALIIDNRDTDRNLGKKYGSPANESYTFDIVF